MGWVPFQMLYLGSFSNVRCTVAADFVLLMVVLLYFGEYRLQGAAVGTHQPADKVLHIEVRRCEHYTVFFGVAEGNSVHHQHEGNLVLDALRLPFLDFVVAAHIF